MTEKPLTQPLRQAMALVYDHLCDLEIEAGELDREGRAKWISQRIAARQFDRRGADAIDNVDTTSLAAAECIFALSLVFE